MQNNMRRLLFWSPRVLSILFTAFISLFALDVFSEGYGFPEIIVALFMHLVPTFVLVVVIVTAWKNELFGGILFLTMGTIFTFGFDTYEELINFLLLSVPLLVAGSLHLINWKISRENKLEK